FLSSTFDAEFVKKLAAQCAARSAATGLPDPMKCGFVSFTHFVPLHTRVNDMRQLAILFARSAAIRCSPGTPGVDLVIPVIMPNAEEEYVVHADNMSYILVQIKNYALRGKDAGYPASATEFNSAVRCGLDSMPQHLYLSLYLALGGSKCYYEVLDKDKQFSLPGGVPSGYKKFIRPRKANRADYQTLRREAQTAFSEYKKKLKSEKKSHSSSEAASWPESLSKVARQSRQTSGAVFGLDTNQYPCLAVTTTSSESVVESLMQMLRAPLNPLDHVKEPERDLLQRMVYPSNLTKMTKALAASVGTGALNVAGGTTSNASEAQKSTKERPLVSVGLRDKDPPLPTTKLDKNRGVQ
ncbi:hypothetical protein HK405_009114, partial [Cladochytrium tenue]